MASVVIQPEELRAGIQNSTNGIAVFKVQPVEGAKEMQVDLPLKQLYAEGQKTADTFRIETGFATLSLPGSLLQGVGTASPGDVRLSVAKVDPAKLPAEAREKIGSAPVFDFNLSLDGKKLGDFGGETVGVAFPYTLQPGENPNQVVVYCILEDGTLELIKNGKYNPKTGQVEFNAKHFSYYTAVPVKVTFRDLAGADWAIQAIEALAAREIVQGIGAGSFNPAGNVTRAEFVTMLVNAFDLRVPTATTAFSDVEKDAWYYNAVASAQKLGIVNGVTGTRFGAQETITRQDMAVMMYRATQVLKIQLAQRSDLPLFKDRAAVGGYAADAVSAMQAAGIIQGMDDGSFAPQAPTTRAQAAVMLHRIL